MNTFTEVEEQRGVGEMDYTVREFRPCKMNSSLRLAQELLGATAKAPGLLGHGTDNEPTLGPAFESKRFRADEVVLTVLPPD